MHVLWEKRRERQREKEKRFALVGLIGSGTRETYIETEKYRYITNENCQNTTTDLERTRGPR